MFMADRHSQETRSYNMSQIHSKDTNPEVLVRKYLFSCGLRYRKNDKRYPGHPDIVLPKYRTVVLVNGCFWHMHEGCPEFVLPKSNQEFWIQKLLRNRQRDAKNITLLEKLGWKVIVVWGCELKKAARQARLEELYKQITEVAPMGS
jgi:DNA mismatch endonuclease (patch repair protein)